MKELKIIIESNIVYDSENKIYKIKALPARCKLLVEGDKYFPEGWCLLKGLLRRKGKALKVKLIFKNSENPHQKERYLPVSCKGTVLELIKIPPKTREILLEPMSSIGEFEIVEGFSLKRIGNIERIYRMYRRIFSFFQKKFNYQRKIVGLSLLTPLINLPRAYELANKIRDCDSALDYPMWIENNERLKQKDLRRIWKDLKQSKLKINFYILIFNNNDKNLYRTTKCIQKQFYNRFKIEVLKKPFKSHFQELLNQISFEKNYLIFMKSGSLLSPHALYWIAKEAESSDADLIYTDHDYIDDENKRFDPCFKPDFSLEFLRSTNYLDFAFAVKADVLSKIEEIDIEEVFDDPHGLLFKVIEKTTDTKIKHIPAVLFHLYPSNINSKEKNILSIKNPVKEHLERVKISASVEKVDSKNYRVIYLLQELPLISILIPTRNQFSVFKNCIESVLNKTTYQNYEIIVIDNQSTEKETIEYIQSLIKISKIRVLSYYRPFNFSAINNYAVKQAKGKVLLFLNNDTEVITPQWLEIMLGCLQQPKVGVVGAKLYYPNGQIQHGGVVVGPGGCADHVFRGLYKDEKGYMDRAILQQEYSAVTAACMMTFKNLFIEVGGFDEENLPISFNDVDYCLKLREAGYRIIFTPYAELVHYESLSRGQDVSPENRGRSKKEADYIRKKWAKFIDYDPFYNPNLSYKKPDFSFNLFPRTKKPWESDVL